MLAAHVKISLWRSIWGEVLFHVTYACFIIIVTESRAVVTTCTEANILWCGQQSLWVSYYNIIFHLWPVQWMVSEWPCHCPVKCFIRTQILQRANWLFECQLWCMKWLCCMPLLGITITYIVLLVKDTHMSDQGVYREKQLGQQTVL